jgi:hypothetical protein
VWLTSIQAQYAACIRRKQIAPNLHEIVQVSAAAELVIVLATVAMDPFTLTCVLDTI